MPGTGKPLSYFDGKADDDILNDENVPVGEKRLETIHKMREARE